METPMKSKINAKNSLIVLVVGSILICLSAWVYGEVKSAPHEKHRLEAEAKYEAIIKARTDAKLKGGAEFKKLP